MGSGTLNHDFTIAYNIPGVPDNASEFLLYASVTCGNSLEHTSQSGDIEFYVLRGGVRCAKYLYMVGYYQDAINTNSDNMWLPMPSNKVVYVKVPTPLTGYCYFVLYVIGYC